MSDSGAKGGLAPLIMGAAVVAGLLLFGLSKRGGDSGTEQLKGSGTTSNPSGMTGAEPSAGGENAAEPQGEFIARDDLKNSG